MNRILSLVLVVLSTSLVGAADLLPAVLVMKPGKERTLEHQETFRPGARGGTRSQLGAVRRYSELTKVEVAPRVGKKDRHVRAAIVDSRRGKKIKLFAAPEASGREYVLRATWDTTVYRFEKVEFTDAFGNTRKTKEWIEVERDESVEEALLVIDLPTFPSYLVAVGDELRIPLPPDLQKLKVKGSRKVKAEIRGNRFLVLTGEKGGSARTRVKLDYRIGKTRREREIAVRVTKEKPEIEVSLEVGEVAAVAAKEIDTLLKLRDGRILAIERIVDPAVAGADFHDAVTVTALRPGETRVRVSYEGRQKARTEPLTFRTELDVVVRVRDD